MADQSRIIPNGMVGGTRAIATLSVHSVSAMPAVSPKIASFFQVRQGHSHPCFTDVASEEQRG